MNSSEDVSPLIWEILTIFPLANVRRYEAQETHGIVAMARIASVSLGVLPIF